MIEAPTLDTTTELLTLVAQRFPPAKATRLSDAVRRYEAGEFPNLDVPAARLLFVAWLIDQRTLTDGLPAAGDQP